MTGTELVGLFYEPLYKYEITIRYVKEDKRAYRIIGGDFVSKEEGEGMVHRAPAYGEIDFEVGEKEGLPLVHTVELNGKVTTDLVTGLTPKMRDYIQKSEAVRELNYGDLLMASTVLNETKNAGNPGEFDYKKNLENRGIRYQSWVKQDNWVKLDSSAGNIVIARSKKVRRKRNGYR